MALICENGLRECNGCGLCAGNMRCDVCENILRGEYISIAGTVVCTDCAAALESEECCSLCGSMTYKGIKIKDITLCRRCAAKRMRKI